MADKLSVKLNNTTTSFTDEAGKTSIVDTPSLLAAITTHNSFLGGGLFPPGVRFLSSDYDRDGVNSCDVVWELPPTLRQFYQTELKFFTPWVVVCFTLQFQNKKYSIAENMRLFINDSQIFSAVTELKIPTFYNVDEQSILASPKTYANINKSLKDLNQQYFTFFKLLEVLKDNLFDVNLIDFGHPDFIKTSDVVRNVGGWPELFQAVDNNASVIELYAAASKFDPRNDTSDTPLQFDFAHLPHVSVQQVFDSFDCHNPTHIPAAPTTMFEYLNRFTKKVL